jgi:hypothetical protein
MDGRGTTSVIHWQWATPCTRLNIATFFGPFSVRRFDTQDFTYFEEFLG